MVESENETAGGSTDNSNYATIRKKLVGISVKMCILRIVRWASTGFFTIFLTGIHCSKIVKKSQKNRTRCRLNAKKGGKKH